VFLERLNAVSARIGGAVAVSLVASDGIPVESVSERRDLDLESAAAELVAMARSVAREQRELSVGELQQFTISGRQLTFLLSRIGRGYWLLAALDPEASLGRARFELKRAALLFEDDLD
jgi:predicted regulator of Ras-like GTPase activity (Roadblock/LC7/MglB family)